MKDEEFERVQKELIALLVKYPADIAASALASWSDISSEIPSYADVRPLLEERMQRRTAVVGAVDRAMKAAHEAPEKEPEGGAERRAGGSRYVFAKIHRRAVYSEDQKPSAEWRRINYPEGMPSDEFYQPPDMGPSVAAVRAYFVDRYGEMKARAWLDRCRAADLDRNILFAPDRWTAFEINDRFDMKPKVVFDESIVKSWCGL
jgi:hypothetical protein